MFDRTKEIWKEFVRRDTEILIGAEVRYNILERQYIEGSSFNTILQCPIHIAIRIAYSHVLK